MNAVKKRIIQFIDSQGISNRKFCIKISVSHVYFSTDNAVGSDVLEKIFIAYPELNMDWVVTGRGEMYNKPERNLTLNDDREVYKTDKDLLIETLKKTIADKEKIIALMESQQYEKKISTKH